jgi:uncharacterized coiled-coil DUF342 family protein
MRKLPRTITGAAIALLSLLSVAAAATPQKQEPPRQEQTRNQKPIRDKVQPPDEVPPQVTWEEALRKTLATLSDQIGLLAGEVRRLRKESERSSLSVELLLAEERLARIDERLDGAFLTKAQFDAQEQQLLRRMRNIQQELIGRAILRRDEAEAAVRAELQRALDETRSQQSFYQSRITDLQSQAERVKARISEIQKKLAPTEQSNEAR